MKLSYVLSYCARANRPILSLELMGCAATTRSRPWRAQAFASPMATEGRCALQRCSPAEDVEISFAPLNGALYLVVYFIMVHHSLVRYI